MGSAGIAVAIVVMGVLSAGALLLVCRALQALLGLVWPSMRTPRAGVIIAIAVLCAVWIVVAVPTLVVNWRAIGYFGLVAIGMALVGGPWIWHLNQRRRQPGNDSGTQCRRV